jgi:arsenite-transporting ATPase
LTPRRPGPPAGEAARYVFFAGKGGVGKTTCAAAAALAAAADGEDVLVVSTDPAHSLGDALDARLGPKPSLVSAGRSAGRGTRRGRLHAAEIDAPTAFRRFMARRREPLAQIVERGTYLDREDAERFVRLSLPGVDELIALLEVTRLARDGGHGRVVVDTAPTGHTLRLLAMPALLERVAEILDELGAKHRFLARSLAGAYRPDAADALVQGLHEQASALRALLRDPARVRFHWVTLPETLAVLETRDGVAALQRDGLPLAEIIVNRGTPPPPGRCVLCEARRRAEAEALADLRKALPALPLRLVPAQDVEPRGSAGLRAVARALRRSPADSVAVPPRPRKPAPAADSAPSSSPPAWLEALLPARPRLVLFAGKGGVGKTTAAAAAALTAAALEPTRRRLLLSADPAHSLGDVFAGDVGDRPRRLAPGLEAREMDAARALAARQEQYRAAVEELFTAAGERGGASAEMDRRAVEDLLDLAPPGIDEIVAMVSVMEALRPGEDGAAYDTVIVDSAPTGHSLRLLAMPELALEWVQAILAVLLKYREVIRLGTLAEELVGLSRALRSLHALLRDREQAAVVVVTRAAELPRREAVRLLAELKRRRLPVSAVLVNARTPPGCARCRRLAAREERELVLLRAALPRTVPIVSTPAAAPPPRGVHALTAWAGRWSVAGDKRRRES